jgi:membrane protein implicated in regulation of membrane protease activity
MWHLILILPLIGLVVFWILPLPIALPVYLILVSMSVVLYVRMVRAMHRPVVTGKQAQIGKIVEVIEMSNHVGRVHFEGASWRAVSDDPLERGDKAIVLGVDGLTLKVGKIPDPEKQ